MICPPYIIDLEGEIAALSHCLTCAESVGFVTGPCSWRYCEFRDDAGRRLPDADGLVAPDRSFHSTASTYGGVRNHG